MSPQVIRRLDRDGTASIERFRRVAGASRECPGEEVQKLQTEVRDLLASGLRVPAVGWISSVVGPPESVGVLPPGRTLDTLAAFAPTRWPSYSLYHRRTPVRPLWPGTTFAPIP